jgi:hypothetical protein
MSAFLTETAQHSADALGMARDHVPVTNHSVKNDTPTKTKQPK